MRKAAVLLLSTAAVLMVVGVLISQSLLILQRVAAVEDVQGMVWVRSRGQTDFAPLSDRARVGAGDVIRTDANARLDLHWVDDTRMRIGPGTTVTVLKSQHNAASKSDAQVFRLDLGRVWIRILKVLSQKSKFEVVTPTATAGVRGTIFSVEVAQGGQTKVSVLEGAVAVKQGAAAAEVPKGQMLDGGQPVQALSGTEEQLWKDNGEVTGPHLEIKSPAPGTKVKVGESVEVAGVAEPDAAVTVNGQPQALELRKRFKTTVTAPAQAGPWQIICEAKDRRSILSRRVVDVEVTP